MRHTPAALALLLVLTACAGGPKGSWPSLSKRPEETIAARLAAEPATPAPPAAATATTLADARLAEIGRDLAALRGRLKTQGDTATKAAAAAKGAARDSQAWSNAQVERTRFARLGARARDLRERLNGIAGDLASAAAAGQEVAAPLAAAGKLIAEVDTLASAQAQTEAALERG